MIVTCERCETQFQLDDARVPPSGVRVRCSRCKHAFQVLRSEGRSLVEAQSAPALPEDEESDWQFNDDLPGDGFENARHALAAPDETPQADDSDVDAQFGWDSDEDPELGDPLARASAEATEDPDSDDGDAHELSQSGLDLLEDLDRSARARKPEPAAAGPGPELPRAFPVAEVAVGAKAPAAVLPRSASEIAAEADAADAPDAQAEWDLLGDEGEGRSSGGTRRLPPAAPGAAAADAGSERPWQRWLGAVSHTLGGSFVALVFLFGLSGAWPAAVPVDAPPPLRLADDLEVAGASGRWVENALHGRLYVVSGSLWNRGSRSTTPPRLQVEWLDREGQVIERVHVVEAASPRRRTELREAPFAELAEAKPLRLGGALPPGKGLPFEVVVPDVPERAAHFQLVIAPQPQRTHARRIAPAAAEPGAAQPPAAAAP